MTEAAIAEVQATDPRDAGDPLQPPLEFGGVRKP